MKKFNRKYVSYQIYTKTICKQIGTPWDYYNNALACMKNPEKYLVDSGDIEIIKSGCCVIRKVTQEWYEEN